jgi:hypothetical protein
MENTQHDTADRRLAATTGSVIRVRYMVEIQSLGGTWQNLATRETELGARKEMSEWEIWLTKNRKTWKDIRIVKESTVQEVLQNETSPSVDAKEK